MDKSATGAEAAGAEATRVGQAADTHAKSSPFENETLLGYVLLIPALTIILTFKAYPFLLGIWFSMTDKLVGYNPYFKVPTGMNHMYLQKLRS